MNEYNKLFECDSNGSLPTEISVETFKSFGDDVAFVCITDFSECDTVCVGIEMSKNDIISMAKQILKHYGEM